MAKGVALTEGQKKDIFDMLEAAMTVREIADLLDLKQDTIYRYKRNWKKQKERSNSVIAEDAETKKETKPGLANSDYAKSYLAGDPSHVRTVFNINRNVTIQSNKSGILYEMEVDGQQIIKVTMPDGQTISIELKLFETLVDEGIDVFLEMSKVKL